MPISMISVGTRIVVGWCLPIFLYWLVVWNMFYFPIYWKSSSQLTFIFFRVVAQPPTSTYIYIYNYIYISRSHRRSTGWMIFTHISIDCPAVRFSLKGDPCRAWSIHWRPGRWIWGITAIVAGWWTTSISSSVIQGGSEVFLSDAQNYCYIYIMIYIYIYMYIWFICIWFICICVYIYIYILLLYWYKLFMYGYILFLYDMLW